MTLPNPVQQFFSIGEVCQLTDLKPHVLRYWESQFRFLNPAKNRSGNRVYKAREVELIMLVKHLLYTEKFTIEGARQRLDLTAFVNAVDVAQNLVLVRTPPGHANGVGRAIDLLGFAG